MGVWDFLIVLVSCVFFFIVDDRKRKTLVPIIQKYVLPGSTIYSDTWRPYFCLSELGYDHHMVNHSVEFVTDAGVHTQNIEHMRGTSKGMLPGYLEKFINRHTLEGVYDFFGHFLGDVARVYNFWQDQEN